MMHSPVQAPKRQTRLFLMIFAPLLALLALGYFFFLKTDYALLYSDLRPEDASAVVAQLDADNIDYRLKDGGTSILVPSDQADQVRLAVAGSDIPQKGMVGFELFNKSDMGLTEFAQKINYQRALQGELARTIMMMDGIDRARVHLAIPERSLFRGNRSVPKAAVTVTAKLGQAIDEARVLGIQRLVAAAVADLSPDDVSVLSDAGRLLSQSRAVDPLLAPEPGMQQYYRTRVRSAVQNVAPGLGFDLNIHLIPSGTARPAGTDTAIAGRELPAGGEGTPRDFRLRIGIYTPTTLNSEEQGLIRSAVAQAVALDEAAGDSIAFSVQPQAVSFPAAAPATGTFSPAASLVPPAAKEPFIPAFDGWLAALVACLGLFLLLRRRGSGLSREDRDSYVLRIRQELDRIEGGGDGRA